MLTLSGRTGVTLDVSWWCVGIQIGRCHIQVVLEVEHTGHRNRKGCGTEWLVNWLHSFFTRITWAFTIIYNSFCYLKILAFTIRAIIIYIICLVRVNIHFMSCMILHWGKYFITSITFKYVSRMWFPLVTVWWRDISRGNWRGCFGGRNFCRTRNYLRTRFNRGTWLKGEIWYWFMFYCNMPLKSRI